MDFETFEQLSLQIGFESRRPFTTAYLAYRTGLPVRLVERYLAHMIENGTLRARASKDGNIEYIIAGTRPAAKAASEADAEELPSMPAFQRPDAPAWLGRPLMAVCLSVLVPGAGHVYSGRTGAGVAWMASTLMGYACCFFPGVFLHGLCMLSAAHAGNRARV